LRFPFAPAAFREAMGLFFLRKRPDAFGSLTTIFIDGSLRFGGCPAPRPT